MSERKPSIEELAQRIDQMLTILKDISEDLADISKNLKGVVAPTPTSVPSTPVQALSMVPPPSGRTRSLADIKAIFPKELENMLFFEDTGTHIMIKPRQYLGSENFAKIASLVRTAGGEYISAGKESHFKVPKETR
jgi:hypothetical protein